MRFFWRSYRPPTEPALDPLSLRGSLHFLPPFSVAGTCCRSGRVGRRCRRLQPPRPRRLAIIVRRAGALPLPFHYPLRFFVGEGWKFFFFLSTPPAGDDNEKVFLNLTSSVVTLSVEFSLSLFPYKIPLLLPFFFWESPRDVASRAGARCFFSFDFLLPFQERLEPPAMPSAAISYRIVYVTLHCTLSLRPLTTSTLTAYHTLPAGSSGDNLSPLPNLTSSHPINLTVNLPSLHTKHCYLCHVPKLLNTTLLKNYPNIHLPFSLK